MLMAKHDAYIFIWQDLVYYGIDYYRVLNICFRQVLVFGIQSLVHVFPLICEVVQ